MNEAVIEKAKELAELLATSTEYVSMRVAENAALKDPKMLDAFDRYNIVHEKIEDVSMAEKPDFDKLAELSRELETVENEIQEMPLAKAMQSSRKKFAELMKAVNDELSKRISPGGSGCSGNCSSCGGCG